MAWILDSSIEADTFSRKELNDLQVKLVKLSSLLQLIEMQIGAKTNNIPDAETVSLKKHRRRFLLRRNKKTNNNSAAVSSDRTTKKPIEIVVSNNDGYIDKSVNSLKPLPIGHHLSSSNPVLNDPSSQPNSLPESWMIQSCNEAETDFNEHSSAYSPLAPTKALLDFVNLANDGKSQ